MDVLKNKSFKHSYTRVCVKRTQKQNGDTNKYKSKIYIMFILKIFNKFYLELFRNHFHKLRFHPIATSEDGISNKFTI